MCYNALCECDLMKKFMIFYLIVLFIQGIFTNMHHALMPYYVGSINLPSYMFGFFFSFMNLGMMIGGPFWGNLADHNKKKISLVIGIVIYAVMQVLFGMGHVFDQWSLSVFRLLSGFGMAAAFTILTGEMIVLSDTNDRAKNIAFGAASLALGAALGQFLGGFIHTNEFVIKYLRTDIFFNAFVFQAVGVLFFALVILIWFKPKKVELDPNKKRTQFWDGFKQIRHIKPQFLYFLIALTFITIAAVNVEKYLDVYFNDIGLLANQLGNFKMVAGIASLLAGVLLVPLFMKIKGRTLLMAIFQIISAVIVIILFRVPNTQFLIYLYTMYLVYIMIKAIFTPIEQVYVSSFAKEHNVATTLGIRQSFYSIGTIVGPIFGAFIYDYNPKLLFDVSAIFFLVSLIFLYLSHHFRDKSYVENITQETL